MLNLSKEVSFIESNSSFTFKKLDLNMILENFENDTITLIVKKEETVEKRKKTFPESIHMIGFGLTTFFGIFIIICVF